MLSENDSFDRKMERSLALIQDICQTLLLKDCSAASFVCALADLNDREANARMKARSLNSILSNMRNINREVNSNLTSLEA